MSEKSAPEKAISITWLGILISCCWPLPPSASKIQIICFKIVRTGCIVSATFLLLPLLYATYLHYKDDYIAFIKSVCLGSAACQIIVQTIFSAFQYDRLQRLIEGMKLFCKNATTEERMILQEYVNKYGVFYGGCMIWIYSSGSMNSLSTIIVDRPFPTDAEYPFRVDYWPIKPIIFCHQAFFCLQCAAHVSMNIFAALILWFATARFDIVMREMRNAKDVSTFINCVRKYQEIRGYAKETVLFVRIIALIATIISAFGLVLSAIVLMGNQPLNIKVEFVFFTLIGLLEAFMCALPADNLLNLSSDLNGAYETRWYLQSLNFQKHVFWAMAPQKPITVSVNCIMPVLSLKYYCAYLSNAFSAFTTLRIVFSDETD